MEKIEIHDIIEEMSEFIEREANMDVASDLRFCYCDTISFNVKNYLIMSLVFKFKYCVCITKIRLRDTIRLINKRFSTFINCCFLFNIP